MIGEAFIRIAFKSYWRSGSGGSGAGDVDGTTVRDGTGLPYVPARQLKGLLRDAASTLAASGYDGWDQRRVSLLFGQEAETAVVMSLPGVLAFRNALAPANVRDAVAKDKKLAATLFTRISSTAIEHETGAAKSKTLRSFEVVVPLTLYGAVRWSPQEREALDSAARVEIAELADVWPKLLDDSAALVTAVGADRSDGYGRAVLDVIGESTGERGIA